MGPRVEQLAAVPLAGRGECSKTPSAFVTRAQDLVLQVETHHNKPMVSGRKTSTAPLPANPAAVGTAGGVSFRERGAASPKTLHEAGNPAVWGGSRPPPVPRPGRGALPTAASGAARAGFRFHRWRAWSPARARGSPAITQLTGSTTGRFRISAARLHQDPSSPRRRPKQVAALWK